jgi:hypothetical protein
MAGAGAFDERYEYSAPRFYDFGKGTPEGEELDEWFDSNEKTAGAGVGQPTFSFCICRLPSGCPPPPLLSPALQR